MPDPVGPADPPDAGSTGHPSHEHYGWRPAIVGRRLHCVLPGAPVGQYRHHPVGIGWCRDEAYLCDGPPGEPWRDWPRCIACAPAHDRYLVLAEVLAAGKTGRTAAELAAALPEVDVAGVLVQVVVERRITDRAGQDGQRRYRLPAPFGGVRRG